MLKYLITSTCRLQQRTRPYEFGQSATLILGVDCMDGISSSADALSDLSVFEKVLDVTDCVIFHLFESVGEYTSEYLKIRIEKKDFAKVLREERRSLIGLGALRCGSCGKLLPQREHLFFSSHVWILRWYLKLYALSNV